MVNAQLGRFGRLFLVPLVLLLLAVMACGTSAPEPASNQSPEAASQSPAEEPQSPAAAAETSSAAVTAPLVGSTPTILAPIMQATPSTAGEGLINFDIKEPVIDPDRSRSPEGSIVLAYHTALSPQVAGPPGGAGLSNALFRLPSVRFLTR